MAAGFPERAAHGLLVGELRDENDATGYKPQDYAKAADLVQRYLEANITEYGEIAADGSISVSHRTGSIVSDWL